MMPHFTPSPSAPVVPRRVARIVRIAAVLAPLVLGACAGTPPAREPAAARPLPPTQVFFYPTQGQSPERQERDRYECYMWAVKQSGFDPSQPQLAPHQRFEVVPTAPPGQDVAVGAVTGAVLGAVVSPPGRAAEGAAVGAVAGAVVGAASEAARQEQAERVQRKVDRRAAERMALLEQRAANYRRAMTACLEGRGYSVR